MPKANPTKVIFRVQDGEVTAYMPELAASNDPQQCECYAHVGQHSAADVSYIRKGRAATPAEYAPLLRELVAIGYKVEVTTRVSSHAYRARVKQINTIRLNPLKSA